MIHWARREHRHGLIESDASDFHKKVYGVAGLAGVRTVPVMVLDDDLADQPGDDVIVAGAGQEPVPEEFEHRLETGLASLADIRLRPGTSAFAGPTADVTA